MRDSTPMRAIYFFMLKTWLLLRSLPSVPMRRLAIPVVFVASWYGLRLLGMTDASAFVFGATFAFAAHIWIQIPGAIQRNRQRGSAHRHWAIGVCVLGFGLCALQIWLLNPTITQRVLTGILILYAVGMAWAASGDRDMLDGILSVNPDGPAYLAFRIHYAQLSVLVVILAIVINETLIMIDAPLGARVGVMSVMQVTLFYTFHIVLRLTVQDSDFAED